MGDTGSMACPRCGADLTEPYAVEYTDTEYVRYHARVTFRGGVAVTSEEPDGSDFLGIKERGVPECQKCGEPVPAERGEHA